MDLVLEYKLYKIDDFPLFALEKDLGKQLEAAQLKCCFPRCDEPKERCSQLNLKDLSISIETFRVAHHNSPKSDRRDKAIKSLLDKIADCTCSIHQTDIPPLFHCYIRDDPGHFMKEASKARRNAKKLKALEQHTFHQGPNRADTPRPETPTQQSHNIPPLTPRPRKLMVSLQSDEISSGSGEEDYFTGPSGAATIAANSEIDPSSPFTASPDSIFDQVLPSVDAYTPATEVSEEVVSTRRQWERNRTPREESPTPRRSRSCAGSSHSEESHCGEIYDEHPAGRVIELDEENYTKVLEEHTRSCSRQPTPPRNPVEKQAVEEYNDNLKQPKTRLHYLEILRKDYGPNAKKEGTVYIAWDEVDPALQGLFKVGTTSKHLSDRYSTDNCDRKHNMRFTEISKDYYVGAERVEKLVHADLYKERMKIKSCAWCRLPDKAKTKGHEEWFKVGFEKIVHSLQQWEHFISLVSYDKEGILSERAVRAIDKILDPRRLISDMEREMGKVPNVRGVPLFSTQDEIKEILRNARTLDEDRGKKVNKVKECLATAVASVPAAAPSEEELTGAQVQDDEPDSDSALQPSFEKAEEIPGEQERGLESSSISSEPSETEPSSEAESLKGDPEQEASPKANPKAKQGHKTVLRRRRKN